MVETPLNIPHINVTVDENDIENGALNILSIIRNQWTKEDVKFKLLTDGITNKLVGCLPEGQPESETVLIRIYGNKTDLLIDRDAETRNIILLNKQNLAPNLYATFDNGLAYRYVPGKTLNCKNVKDPNIYKLVAKRMAKLHHVSSGEDQKSREPFIWKKIEAFLDLVPEVLSDPEKNKRREELLPPKEKIREEVQFLRSILEGVDNTIVFCHNDLLLGNVIYTESANTVTFIDFEYAALNYQAYDIGNHFAEFAGIDLSDLDYSRYPEKEFQLEWITTYLEEFLGRPPSSDEVEVLYVQANKFCLLCHVFWAIWSLIQAEHSYVDFDYVSYSVARLSEYFNRKEEFLSR